MGIMDAAREQAAQNGGQIAKPVGTAEGTTKSHGAEYQRKQKAERYQFGLALKTYLERKGLLKEVQADPALASGFEKLIKEPGTGAAFGGMQTPLIYRLFGDAPKVGQRVTALEVFQKTRKGYNEFKQQVKKWLDKGVCECAYDEKTQPQNPAWVLNKIIKLPATQVPASEV